MKNKAENLIRILSVLICCILLAGCSDTGGHGAKETAAPTEQAAYEIQRIIRYWPEDADYSTCDYACIMEKPVFSRTLEAGAAMNKAVDGYFDGLFERIEKEYAQASVAKPPYTEVSCGVEQYGEYTEVILTEKHCYEAQPYTETHVLTLDGRGGEVNANDVFRTYHADELIANALLGVMRETGYCYDGVTLNDVLAKLDIARGCLADETGATVFLPEGAFAPYDYGELALKVPVESIRPDFVGNTVSAEEYAGIQKLTDAVSSACIVREMNVEDGILTAYVATAFMGSVMQRSDYPLEKGRILVSADEFERYYYNCFGNEFPGIDTDGFDIRTDNGKYSVSSTQKVYEYHLDIHSAVREGDTLILTADIVFGGYGYPYSTPVCRVNAVLKTNGDSPYGFTLVDYVMSL